MPERHPTSSPSLSLWPAVGLGLGVAVGNGFARFAYALILPAMRADLGWTYAEAGWLNTANAIGYIVGAISAYVLLQRWRPSQLFTSGLILTVLALTVTGARPDLAWLSMARIIAGIGAAWAFSCGGALVAAQYEDSPERRGIATGTYFAGAGIGIGLSGALTYPILGLGGIAAWPMAWAILGCIAAVLSVWPCLLATRIKSSANSRDSTPIDLRGLIPAMLAYFLFAGGYIVYMTFIFAWIRSQNMSPAFGTMVWLILGGAVTASPFIWRRALEHWVPTRTLAACCAITLTGSLIPWITTSALAIIASAALFGIGMFIAPSAMAVLSRRILPSPQWAKAITLFTVIFAVGQSIGPVLAGWIADRTSLDRSLLFGATLLGAASLIALIPTSRTISSIR